MSRTEIQKRKQENHNRLMKLLSMSRQIADELKFNIHLNAITGRQNKHLNDAFSSQNEAITSLMNMLKDY